MSAPKCPGCQQSNIKKLNGQRAVCRTCSKAKGSVFQFCWACQREWPHGASTTKSCKLPNCAVRAALLSVKQISDPNSSVNGCPFFRPCPDCKAILTHSGEGCPNIVCPHCDVEFCFRCLRQRCFDNDYYIDSDYDDDDDDDDDDDFENESCVIVDNSEILQNL